MGFIKFIKDRFGSKRGFLNTIKYKLLFLMGSYKKYKQIDFSRVEHLVFVCSGNICRSSLAEYIAKSEGVSSESYGLHCRGGDKADLRAIKYAKHKKIDMSTHITRNIKDYKPKPTDLIVAMEPAHINELTSLGLNKYQITTLPIWSIRNIYLHDPFNSNLEFFERCGSIVMSGVLSLRRLLIKN